jgi:cation:H+ antiporter
MLLVCVAGASFASRQAVGTALEIADSMKVSPALVGVTVMAIGTDLPEIANSIVASASGHGDINVGDSMGSAVTQVTLVLGILCLATTTITADRNFVISVGVAALFASVTVWVQVRDGGLSHLDGLVLVLLWAAGTMLLGHGELRARERGGADRRRLTVDVILTIAWLGLVGLCAIGIVQSFLVIAERFGIPEFVGSFVVLSIGTSLPELIVDWTAIRRGASSMAVGDIFGSSFVDATLSIGIGPLIFSSVVSTGTSTGVAIAAAGILLATVLVARSARYDRRLGWLLLVLYASVQISVASLGI